MRIGCLTSKKGFSLVELVITISLLAIFLVSVISLFDPFTRVFFSIQDLNRAQTMSDTILEIVQGQLEKATWITEIHTDAIHGQIILFKDIDGVYRIIELRGGNRTVTDKEGVLDPVNYTLESGQLWISYYHEAPVMADPVSYESTRGVEQALSNDFYHEQFVKLSYQPTIFEDAGLDKVLYIEITVEVWNNNRQITNEKGVVRMQYRPGIG